MELRNLYLYRDKHNSQFLTPTKVLDWRKVGGNRLDIHYYDTDVFKPRKNNRSGAHKTDRDYVVGWVKKMANYPVDLIEMSPSANWNNKILRQYGLPEK